MDNDQQPPPAPPEAPDAEKMDQIRRQRLEKLSGASTLKSTEKTQGVSGSSSSSIAPVSSEASSSAPKPKINIAKAASPPLGSSSKVNANPSNGADASIVRNAPAEKDLKRPRAKSDGQTLPQTKTPKKQAPVSVEESLEAYENRTLGGIFRITLDPNQTVDSSNHKLIYLPNLRRELEDEKAPIMLTKERLDSAIHEAASTIPYSKGALDYLIPCWKRVMRTLKGLRGLSSAKDAILKEAKRLCMSNCVFAVEMPEFFGREPNPELDSLTPYLLLEPVEERGISPDFLAELEARFEEDDSIKPMLRKAVIGLSQQLATLSMNDSYKPYVHALKALSQFPKFVTAIAEDPLFQMATSAPGIEKYTILGPFFRISPLQAEVTKEYFAAPKTMDKRKIHTSQEALRLTLQTHQRDLLDIINLFVRASPEAKNKTLDWFAYIVNSNHKRRALRPNPAELSSDGFLMNVTVVLDGLCEPFMDATFSKVSRIDVDYLRRNPRVDISDETKLNADESASTEYYQTVASGTSNFISEVFFLTLAAHHYGSEATNNMLKSLDKEIKYLADKVKELEAERPKFASSPANMLRLDEQIRRVNDTIDKSMSFKFAVEGVLFDKVMQARSLTFMRVVTVWLLRIATQSVYTPDKTIKLPLPAEQPDAFRFLPEYVLEDIVGNFNFIFRFIPDVMISAVGDEVIALCITFLTNSEYVKNPYLKAKLVSLLFHGTWPVYHRTKGVLGDSLIGTKFANDHLLHALMKFYIEVESTGAHTQFYDKFNIRYEIFQVIKCIWTNTVYQERLTQESKTNTEFFLRFVNLLLNDATYVLDEALTKFPRIHALQEQLRLPNTLTAEERTAKQEELATAEGQAQSYMQLTNETVSMMKLFTKTLSASFTMPEIVERVAAMLDYTLDTIVGSKSTDLKVDDPKKYQFQPRTLLNEFIEIYLNLGVSERFVEAVAGDGRSYKPENFERASRILMRHNLRPAEDIEAWEKLLGRFKIAKELEDQNEEDLGDIPDEYLDPIMATLMKDPVILPISKQVIDRSTIRSHLLSDPHDPFNRSPLKIEDVIDDTALKEKIIAWRAEMMQKARAARADDNAMDTTDG